MRRFLLRAAAWRRLVAGAALGLAAACALADPPASVGRVSWIAGNVTLVQGADAPTPAQLNWPVTSGQQYSTAPTGRVELWSGSNAIRLDVDSAVRIEQLDDSQLHLRLERGSVVLRIASSDASHQASIETPLGRFTPHNAGEWRLDLRGDSVSATSLHGTLDFDDRGTRVSVSSGQRADVSAANGHLATSFATAAADDFLNFVHSRDAAYDGKVAVRYVSPEMTGVETLDAFGHWEQTADYGNVWVPSVASDWAPYRDGHWAWVSPWGWTWIDAAPWGFAPFHYGRWAMWQDRWAWVPGAYAARPVYAPALVGWAGGVAPGVSVNVSVGTVGWFPLAPHEVYVPPYAASVSYVRNVNVTHVTNITNVTTIVAPTHYAFQDDRRATTVVNPRVLAEHRAVAREVQHAALVNTHAAPPPHGAPVGVPRNVPPAVHALREEHEAHERGPRDMQREPAASHRMRPPGAPEREPHDPHEPHERPGRE